MKDVRKSATGVVRPARLKGFTLLEIMVVVILITLLSVLSGGYYLRSRQRWQIEKSAQDIYLLARYARIGALERQSRCNLYVDQAGGRLWLTHFEANEEGEREETVLENRFSRPIELEEPVRIMNVEVKPLYDEGEQSGEETNRSITFRPDGTADQALITVGGGELFFTITVDAGTGRARCRDGIVRELPDEVIDLDRQNL